MIRLILFSFAFLLLQNSVFAVGGERSVVPISINTDEVLEHGGVFKNLKKRFLKKRMEKMLKKIENQDCDRILFYSGSEIEVSIVKIEGNVVTFKDCDTDGPATDSLFCRTVDMIFRPGNVEYMCAHETYPRRSSEAKFIEVSGMGYQMDQECDLLILMNKDQLEVEILKINQDNVVFKNCNNTNGLDSLSNSMIRTIRQKDGRATRVNYYGNESEAGKVLGSFGRIFLIVILSVSILLLLLVILVNALFF